jgi:hypothetical protein
MMGTTTSRVRRAEFLVQCAVTALATTLEDVLSHRFTLSLKKDRVVITVVTGDSGVQIFQTHPSHVDNI